MRRIFAPSPQTMMAGVLAVAAIAIASLVVSILSLRAAVDNASRRATRAALCDFYRFQIPQPGDPEPTTDRGRLQVQRAVDEYEHLHCWRS